MNTDYLHQIYAHAMRHIAEYGRCVDEGKNVDAASVFAGFILNSGICGLMDKHPETNARLAILQPHDGDVLHGAAKELKQACCDYWAGRTGKSEGAAKGISISALTSIEHKLAELERRSRRKPKPKTAVTVVDFQRLPSLGAARDGG